MSFQDSTIGDKLKLEGVPKYRTTLAEELAQGIRTKGKMEKAPEGGETEDEEHVDLATPFAEMGALQESWMNLGDDAAILATDEGKERDAANTHALFAQGLHVLRAAKIEEQEALQDQAIALQQQALGVKRQQRAIHLGLCAIQRMELAVAFTPAMETTNTLWQAVLSAQELGLRQSFTPNPDLAAAAKDLAAVHVQRAARLPQGSQATGKTPYSMAIPSACVMNAAGKWEDRRPVVQYKNDAKRTRYYDCPWTSCAHTTASRDGMNAHIRFHTDQVLLCPNGDKCPDTPKDGHPFAHRNADSLRAHYKKDAAAGILAVDKNEVVAVQQIMTPDWFLARQIYKTQ